MQRSCISVNKDIADLRKTIKDFIENNRIKSEDISTGEIVKQLRIIFSELGLEMLKPDLVIMDEFQKFKDLIGVEQESETNLIAKKFFNKKNLKILQNKIQ